MITYSFTTCPSSDGTVPVSWLLLTYLAIMIMMMMMMMMMRRRRREKCFTRMSVLLTVPLTVGEAPAVVEWYQ
jgi:hypothetical protein